VGIAWFVVVRRGGIAVDSSSLAVVAVVVVEAAHVVSILQRCTGFGCWAVLCGIGFVAMSLSD